MNLCQFSSVVLSNFENLNHNWSDMILTKVSKRKVGLNLQSLSSCYSWILLIFLIRKLYHWIMFLWVSCERLTLCHTVLVIHSKSLLYSMKFNQRFNLILFNCTRNQDNSREEEFVLVKEISKFWSWDEKLRDFEKVFCSHVS